jgi:hypothetical protein
MNFLQYRDAQDMMAKTGLSPREILDLINQELQKMTQEQN